MTGGDESEGLHSPPWTRNPLRATCLGSAWDRCLAHTLPSLPGVGPCEDPRHPRPRPEPRFGVSSAPRRHDHAHPTHAKSHWPLLTLPGPLRVNSSGRTAHLGVSPWPGGPAKQGPCTFRGCSPKAEHRIWHPGGAKPSFGFLDELFSKGCLCAVSYARLAEERRPECWLQRAYYVSATGPPAASQEEERSAGPTLHLKIDQLLRF